MEDSEVLALLRASVIVLDPLGTIVKAAGGIEGLLGFDVDELVGRNGLDFVAPRDHEAVAFMFLGDPNHVRRRISPPFAVRLIDRVGQIQAVECLATGVPTEGGFSWVLTLTPRDLQPVSYHALDRYLEGADAPEVATAVVDRLSTTSPEGVRIEGFVLHRRVDGVLSAVRGDHGSQVSDALRSCVRDPAAPWHGGDGDRTPMGLDALPLAVGDAARAEGFCVADQRTAALSGLSETVMVLFANHPTAFHGNVSMILDDAAGIVSMALTRTRADELLRQAAEQDPLTGLVNRNRFATAMADDGAGPDAVLFVDVDYFKSINDRFGHVVGDGVLVEVAQRITSACRPGDEVARLGGDEFAVLLRGVDVRVARQIGERVLTMIAAPLPSGVGPEAVTATVGLAISGDVDGDLVAAADLAMLAGKRSGRGRLARAPSDGCLVPSSAGPPSRARTSGG